MSNIIPFKEVTQEFYNMFKGMHRSIYNGKFIRVTPKGKEFIIRGYKIVNNEPVDLLAYYNRESGYRIRKDIIKEFNKLNELINYKD